MEDAMCRHLNAFGQFQSDQYPDMLPGEIVLSLRDPAAIEALHAFSELTEDDDLTVAIVKRLDAIAEENLQLNCHILPSYGGCTQSLNPSSK
jgi:hypothetical protein